MITLYLDKNSMIHLENNKLVKLRYFPENAESIQINYYKTQLINPLMSISTLPLMMSKIIWHYTE